MLAAQQLSAAPTRGPLERAREAHLALAATLVSLGAPALADAELRAARGARSAAEAGLVEVSREVAAAWDALHGARDPLVVLGAPAVTGDDLLAAWAALTRWATAEIARRDAELPDAELAAAAARDNRDAAERALADDLAAHDVHVRTDRPMAASVLAVVAEALAESRSLHDRIAERRNEAAALRAQRSEAETAQQVARTLGDLLRSNNFPAGWWPRPWTSWSPMRPRAC